MSNYMEFVFDSNIKPVEKSNIKQYIDKNNFIKLLSESKTKTSQIKPYSSNDYLEPIIDNILDKSIDISNENIEFYKEDFKNTNIDFYHMSYIDYLKHAYVNDYGIEIAPWYLYHVIFFQVAQIIKTNGSKFRDVFTNSDEKINLTFEQDEIDINQYVSFIRKLIPNSDTYDVFFPQWSPLKLSPYYNHTLSGLFADMVQEYYGCMILGCSLPKVKIYGDQNDWNILSLTIDKLYQTLYDRLDLIDRKYFDTLKTYIQHLQYNWSFPDTWKNFFFIEHCGSGHQTSLSGDFRKLLNYNIDHELLPDSLPSMISRFPFVNTNNKIGCHNSFFISGLIGSNISTDGYLCPVYDYAITYIDLNIKDLNINIDRKNLYMEFLPLIKKLNRLCRYDSHIVDINNTIVKSFLKSSIYEYLNKNPKKNHNIFGAFKSPKNNHVEIFMDEKFPHLSLKDKQDIISFDIQIHNRTRLEFLPYTHNIWLGNSYYTNNIFTYNVEITLEQYLANKNTASEYYSDLLDYDKFKWFVNTFHTLQKILDAVDYLNYIIYYTFDPNVYSKYCDILKEFGLMKLYDDFIKLIKQTFIEIKQSYTLRLIPSDRMAKYLKDDITKII